MKTVDTRGSGWLQRMRAHIDDLKNRGATVDDVNADMALDLRVQPGGLNEAEQLKSYAEAAGVEIILKEFPE